MADPFESLPNLSSFASSTSLLVLIDLQTDRKTDYETDYKTNRKTDC